MHALRYLSGHTARPQFLSETLILTVQPWIFRIPSMRALKLTTRLAKAQSLAVHFDAGLALSAASAGSRRRVDWKLADLARGSFAHARIARGCMLTSWLNLFA